jgi:hypothetical protein
MVQGNYRPHRPQKHMTLSRKDNLADANADGMRTLGRNADAKSRPADGSESRQRFCVRTLRHSEN